MAQRADVRVSDRPDEQRYVAVVAEEVAGCAQYLLRPGVIGFLHTAVNDRFAAEGVGAALARGALDDARERALGVLPFCPFIRDFIARERDAYLALVPEGRRAQFRLDQPLAEAPRGRVTPAPRPPA